MKVDCVAFLLTLTVFCRVIASADELVGATSTADPVSGTISPTIATQNLPYGEFQPNQDELPSPTPGNAIVLFDGLGVNEFLGKTGEAINWKTVDGALVSTRGGARSNHVVSKVHFRDADIHAEFMLPDTGSGNSGLYIHGNYEVQIFNSLGKAKPDEKDMGGIYGFSKPLVNATLKPGVWQVYDIRYIAPRRGEDGEIIEDGSITAWLNGQLVQDHARFGEPKSKYHPFRYKTTPYLKSIWEQQKATSVGPLFLQDHDSPVKFRNIWVLPLGDIGDPAD